MLQYIKYSRECFITFPSIFDDVQSVWKCETFSRVRYIIFSTETKTHGENGENCKKIGKIVKIYAN